MLSTSLIPISLCIIYIIIVVFVGPYYMANKKPFTLKNTILIYNIGQIFACTYIVIEVCLMNIYLIIIYLFCNYFQLLKSGPKFGCDSLNEDVDDPITLHVNNNSILFYKSRILVLLTIFNIIVLDN